MNNNFKISDFDELAQTFNDYEFFYITGHANPDGDSNGSCVCLAHALESMGKKCILKPVPFLAETPDVLSKKGLSLNELCFVQLDVQPEYRLPKEALEIKKESKFSICFDHHQSEELNCNLVYIDSTASANALIIWEFVKFLNVEISKEMATAAYFGLCSDTNSFMNTNTDKRSFKAACEMMDYDVEASKVAKILFQSRSKESFELEKIVLDRLYVDTENRFDLSYLTADNYEKYNATKDDSDASIDLLRTLECIDVACVIRQENPGEKIRGSLRSKTQTDVSKLAKLHIGGGHKAAAGFTMEETDMDAAVKIIKKQLEDLMQGKI